MACNSVPPPVLPENTLILHHIHRGLTVKSVSSSPNSGQPLQHYAVTLNDILRAHLNCQASTIGGEAEEGCASVCKMRRGAGCAVVKWKLCGGNLSRLGFGAVHSHACIIYPFSLASMHPLSSELPHHIGLLCRLFF